MASYICDKIVCLYRVDDIDKSNLYLKLFKLVFGSVTLFAQENEVMLKVIQNSLVVYHF